MSDQNDMTAEEFLEYADQHPYTLFDFLDGNIVEVLPTVARGRIKAVFGAEFSIYTRSNTVGVAYIGALHVLDGEKLLPDASINVVTDADYLITPPLVAVKISSINQNDESQRRNVQSFLKHGTKLSILVFPGESIEVYRPGHDVLVLSGDDTLDGADVLPGFQIPVKELI